MIKRLEKLKKLELHYLPIILIIHLKRFDKEKKLNNNIIFPLNQLNLAKFTSNIESNKDLEYDLIGVINHYGNPNSGHYISYIKDSENDRWHVFNDSFTAEVNDINTIASKDAYVLIYKRNINNDAIERIYNKKFINIILENENTLVDYYNN